MPETKPEKKAAETTTQATKRFSYTDEDVTFTLQSPVTLGKGEQVIESLTIRKPRSSELRGLSLFDVMHLDTDSLIKLLPRISTPIMHKVIAEQLDPADLMTIGKCVSGFFTGTSQRADLIAEMENAAAQE